MIRNYDFNYNLFDASAAFTVDTEIFTAEMAMITLNFFTWDYDEDADPIDEVMKKYGMECIRQATINNYNVNGVIGEFNNKEGFCRIDGTMGIQLTNVDEYEFDDDLLQMEVEHK